MTKKNIDWEQRYNELHRITNQEIDLFSNKLKIATEALQDIKDFDFTDIEGNYAYEKAEQALDKIKEMEK